jgi:hypothetical protein
MIIFSDFQWIGNIQVAIFTPNFSFLTPRVLSEVFQINPGAFDGDPVVLPLPEDAPVDVPRIILQTKDGTEKFEASPARINYHRVRRGMDDNFDAQEFVSAAADFCIEYLRRTKAECGRVAAILNRFAFNDHPGKEVANHFCKQEFLETPFDSPKEFQIHSLKSYRYKDVFQINSWVRVKSARLSIPGEEARQVINVEQDINTLSELMAERSYDLEEIGLFYSEISSEFDSILRMYFPAENKV